MVDNGRARREAELAAQDAACQLTPVRPTTSVEPGVVFNSLGVLCLTLALRNAWLPKDFKGPHKVPNYTANLPPESWVESYEMAMEMLDVDEAACAKYFTMMLEGTTRNWLKSLPANSIGSWAESKFQSHVQTTHVNCGLSRMCSRGGGVHNPLGKASLSYSAFIRPHQC